MWLPADSESSSRANTDAGTSNDGAKTATLQLDLKQLIEQLQAAQNPVPVDNSTRGATRGGAAAAPSLYPTGAGVVAIDLDAQSVKVTLTDGSIRLRVSRPAAPDIRPTRSYTKGSYPSSPIDETGRMPSFRGALPSKVRDAAVDRTDKLLMTLASSGMQSLADWKMRLNADGSEMIFTPNDMMVTPATGALAGSGLVGLAIKTPDQLKALYCASGSTLGGTTDSRLQFAAQMQAGVDLNAMVDMVTLAGQLAEGAVKLFFRQETQGEDLEVGEMSDGGDDGIFADCGTGDFGNEV